jgi:hypothetical protein
VAIKQWEQEQKQNAIKKQEAEINNKRAAAYGHLKN